MLQTVRRMDRMAQCDRKLRELDTMKLDRDACIPDCSNKHTYGTHEHMAQRLTKPAHALK